MNKRKHEKNATTLNESTQTYNSLKKKLKTIQNTQNNQKEQHEQTHITKSNIYKTKK